MPEILTKKMFGLPRWAWLIILATAIGVGLYLRHKHSQEEEVEANSEESPVGVVGSEAVPVGGYNEAGEGGGYYYGEGGGGFVNEGVPSEEGEGHPETVINIGGQPLPSASDGNEGAPPPSSESAGVSGTPCGEKPGNIPAGFKAECVSGRWKLVAKTNAKKPAVSTGGGPPNRPNNKRPQIGIGQARPVGGGGGGAPAQNAQGGTPQNNAQHPAAVNTGNKCVNGGVGGHTAPSGYHLFCQGGWIWRAPNS